MVDTGYRQYASSIKKELAKLQDSIPRIIINTHLHIDHTGGNDSFGGNPVILAHTNVNRDMMEGRYMLRGLTEKSKPQFVVDQPTSIFFNEEEVKIIPIPGSHSDGDMVVYFTRSKVMVTGDVGYGMKYPSYDLYNGNSSLYAQAAQKILKESEDKQITYISGHGRDLTREDMIQWVDMLQSTASIVKDQMNKGKDIETIQKENDFANWRSFEGGYTSKNKWNKDLFLSITHPQRFPTLIPLMDKAYQIDGLKGAIKKFHEVKGEIKKEDIITGNLQSYSTILQNRGAIDEAIELLKLLLTDYADYPFIWINYANLGNLYMKKEEWALARKYLQMSMDLNPTEYVSSRLEEIKNK